MFAGCPAVGSEGRILLILDIRKRTVGAGLLVMEPFGGPGVTVTHLVPENTVCDITVHTESLPRLKTTYIAKYFTIM